MHSSGHQGEGQVGQVQLEAINFTGSMDLILEKAGNTTVS